MTVSNRDAAIERLVKQEKYNITDLREVVSLLRGEGGCPWDMEQTHQSIRNDLIEETYEVVEAIDNRDASLLREELGDLLFQVIFHAQIEEEHNTFALDDIVSDVCAKMIHRHPHVFGTVQVKNTGEVLKNWDAIKTEEKQRITLTDKLRAIPPMLPSLMRAQKVAKKSGVYENVSRESIACDVMKNAEALLRSDDQAEAIGALLMTVCAYAHTVGISAEEILSLETNRFIDSLDGKEN